MKYLFLLFPLLTFYSHLLAQEKSLQRNWSAFTQEVDVRKYREGQFKLTAFIKADVMSSKSSAHMWARIDKSGGKVGFFNNMYDKPIQTNEWKAYTLEGEIDKKAENLVFGGLYFNRGIYYYDQFSLKVKPKEGEWVNIPLENGGFESEDLQGWKITPVQGFIQKITNSTYVEGTSSLVIDGSTNVSFGNNSASGSYANINGIKVYYETYGEGEPLVLLHGNYQSIHAFRHQIPVLAKHYKVIAIDTRGQGNSTEDGQELTYELFAEDLITLLDHLHLDSVNLLGWSDGGNTGLIAAMHHPEKIKKLAIMGAVLYNDSTSIKPDINKLLKDDLDNLNRKTDQNTFEKRMINLLLHEPNLSPIDLQNIACPTLVMAGSDDLVIETHTELIAENIPKSTLIIFPDGSHFEPEEKPERFNKAVLDFFGKSK